MPTKPLLPHAWVRAARKRLLHGGNSPLPNGDSMVLVVLGLKAWYQGQHHPMAQNFLSFYAWPFLKQKFSWRSLSGEVERE